jgi:hypothetical protein
VQNVWNKPVYVRQVGMISRVFTRTCMTYVVGRLRLTSASKDIKGMKHFIYLHKALVNVKTICIFNKIGFF